MAETVYCADCDVTFASIEEWHEHDAMMEEIGPDESRQLRERLRHAPAGALALVREIMAGEEEG